MIELLRPYPPFDTMSFNNSIPFASFQSTCEHNLIVKTPSEGACTGGESPAPIHMLAEFETPNYQKDIEVEADGFGKERQIKKQVIARYGVQAVANEYILKFLYEMIYKNQKLEFEFHETQGGSPTVFLAENIEMENEQILDGIHAIRITYEYNGEGFGPFGVTGCCRALYQEAPYEDPCADTEPDPITINPDQLNYIPTETNNVSNLNEIVIAADLSIWIIDWQGTGICVTRTAGDFEITSSDRGWILRNTFGERWRVRQNNAGDLFTEKL